MFDFRLKVFLAAARRLNFTRAAEELYISQPAVTKHIREIEKHYGVQLFRRNGTRIQLTKAGTRLLEWAERLLSLHRQLDMELAAADAHVKGELRIGASTTVAQYILPQYLAGFKRTFADVQVHLTSANTEKIEEGISKNRFDAGIVEGHTRRKELKYQSFLRDEIVLCSKSAPASAHSLTLVELQRLPLVLREQGSGTRQVLDAALQRAGLDIRQLHVDIVLESTESIKQYLVHSNSYAFVSVHAVVAELHAGTLQITDVQGLTIERSFSFVKRMGDDSASTDLLWRFLKSHNPEL